MIVAVTGASGHIGANLVRSLIKQGRKVRALVHQNRQPLEGLPVEIVQGNITDPYSVYRTLSGVEIVYHLASIVPLPGTKWANLEAVNIFGTQNVVEACQKCNVRRLIHFSSIQAVVQEPLDTPVDEFRPLVDSLGTPPYERSIAAAETEVRRGIENGLDAIILCPSAVIGPLDFRLSFSSELLLALAQGKLPALIEGGLNWVDVKDVVVAALVAEDMAPFGAKYLLSGHYASFQELAGLIEQILGIPAPRLITPAWLARTGISAARPFTGLVGSRQIFSPFILRTLSNFNHNISHERASRELNFFPRPLSSTLVDTLHWFQENGLLDQSVTIKKTEP
jgi:dihydroflavonol-4-reductase